MKVEFFFFSSVVMGFFFGGVIYRGLRGLGSCMDGCFAGRQWHGYSLADGMG